MINKKGWFLACLLAAFMISLTSFWLICWGIKLIFIVKKLNLDPYSVASFTPLIWHIEELGEKIERVGAVFWMALGGAIIQTINGLWRWMSKD